MRILSILMLCAVLVFAGCGAGDRTEYELSSGAVPEEESSPDGDSSPDAEISPEKKEFPKEGTDGSAEMTGTVFVYVCGAVRTPGVYELPAGSRVFEAIEAAGGLSGEADARSLNQAALLSDGEQITVLTSAEAAAARSGKDSDDSPDGAADDGLVNINTADASVLMSLPGIGASKAGAIIAYREEHGAFETPQDICKVNGIKEKLYARIEALIKV